MQTHRPRRKVHVIHPYPQQFAPPGARVGGQADHWVEKWLRGTVANVLEQLLDLRSCQKQRIPKLAYLGISESATGHLALNFRPRLEGRLFVRFGINQPPPRKNLP